LYLSLDHCGLWVSVVIVVTGMNTLRFQARLTRLGSRRSRR